MILVVVAGIIAALVLAAVVTGMLWLVQFVLNTEEGRRPESR